MRRVLFVVAALVILVLAWFLLREETTRVNIGPGGASAANGDAAAELNAERRRERTKTPEEIAEAALSEFQSQWPEIGQNRPQDPALAAIRGRLFSAPERPVSEGVVETSVRGEVSARARVKKDGSFHLLNVAPGKGIALTGHATGYASGGFDKLMLQPGETLDVGAIFLGSALDPDATNRVVVKIVKAEGGEAVEGASVTATSASYGALIALGSWEKTPGATVIRKTSDVNGVVVFEKLPPAFYDVYAEAEGFTFVADIHNLVHHETQLDLTIELAPGLTIEGRVLDEEGKPIEGVRLGALKLGNFTMVPATSSGADGAFSIGGLSKGSHWLWAGKEGRGQKDVPGVEAGTKDVTIVIPQGQSLAIRVLDAATGAPVKSYGVRPFKNQPFAYQFSPRIEVMAEDGIWRQALDAGSWGVEVTAPGYALKTVNSVKLGAAEPLDVKLDSAGVIHGRVIAKSTSSPVRGARVFVKRGGMPPGPVKDMQGATDGNGEFVLDGFPRSPVKLTVQHVDHTEQTFDVEPAARGEGGALPPVIDLALGEGGRVEGHAYGPGRAPLTGQQIVLGMGFDWTTMRSVAVGADGSFAFRNVPPGKYTVTLGQGVGGGRGEQRSQAEVTEGGLVTVDFGADAGGQRVTGRVVRADPDAKDGGSQPVAGVALTLDDGAGGNARATSDAQGRFTFEGVQAGTYTVRPSGGSTHSASVVVKAEEPPAEVVLTLPASGSIEGRIVNEATGNPLPGAFLNVEQTSDATGNAITGSRTTRFTDRPTSADGAFRFSNLEAGRYTIRVYCDPYGSVVLEGVALGSGEAKSGVEIKMGVGGTLSGKASGAGGTSVEGAAVQIRDMNGRSVFILSFVNTSADGTFVQGQLQPGEYDVTLEKDGWAPATKRVVIEAGKETKTEFTMLQGGRVELTAMRAGMPVAGAAVTILDASGRRVEKGLTLQNLFSNATQKTDTHGQITIRGLAAGRYTLRLKDGATQAEGVADVVEGAPVAVEIVFPAQ